MSTCLRAILSVAVGIAAALAGASDVNESLPDDIRRIKQRGKLVVLQYCGERPGFFAVDDSADGSTGILCDGRRVTGYDIELAQRIASRLGVELELRRSAPTFDGVCRGVARGEADLGISKLTITFERGQYVRFTEPYIQLRLGLLINRLVEANGGGEGSGIAICQRPGTVIAVEKGTAWVEYARDAFPQAQITEHANLDAVCQAVKQGQAMALLTDEWNLGTLLRQNPELPVWLRLAWVPGRRMGTAIAVSPKDQHLLAFLNLLIESDSLRRTPEALLNRYFPRERTEHVSATMELASRGSNNGAGGYSVLALSTVLLCGLIALWLWIARGGIPTARADS